MSSPEAPGPAVPSWGALVAAWVALGVIVGLLGALTAAVIAHRRARFRGDE